MFSRSQIQLLRALVRPMALSELATALSLSISRTSELVSDLCNKRFLEKEGRQIKWTEYPYAALLRKVMHSNPSLAFDDFLYGKRLDVLLEVCFEGGKGPAHSGLNLNLIASGARTTEDNALNILYELKKRSLVYKEADFWFFNNRVWPELADFLIQYKQFAGQELVFVPRGEWYPGTLTGFSVYPKYGVLVYPKTDLRYDRKRRSGCLQNDLYRTINEKLSIEDVFIHSLYEVNDERTTRFAEEFFRKNRGKMDMKKVEVLAVFFGLKGKLDEVMAG